MSNPPKGPRIPSIKVPQLNMLRAKDFKIVFPKVDLARFQLFGLGGPNPIQAYGPVPPFRPIQPIESYGIANAMLNSAQHPNKAGHVIPNYSEPDHSASFGSGALFDEDKSITFEEFTEENLAQLIPSSEDEESKGELESDSAKIDCDVPANIVSVKAEPPPIAEWLVTAMLPAKRREAIHGDLDERFSNELKKYGAARASRLYWARAAGELISVAWSALRKLRALVLLEAVWKIFKG